MANAKRKEKRVERKAVRKTKRVARRAKTKTKIKEKVAEIDREDIVHILNEVSPANFEQLRGVIVDKILALVRG